MKHIYRNYDVLANAIINQAYYDAIFVKGNLHSKNVERRHSAERLKRENEDFVNSEWFKELCLLANGGK